MGKGMSLPFHAELTAVIPHPQREKETTAGPLWLLAAGVSPQLPFWRPGSCSHIPAPAPLCCPTPPSRKLAFGGWSWVWRTHYPGSPGTSGRALPADSARLWAPSLGRKRRREKPGLEALRVGSGIDSMQLQLGAGKGPRVTAACTAPPAVGDLGELRLSSRRVIVKGGGEEASLGRRGPGQVWAAGPAPRPAPPPWGRATLPAPRPGLARRREGRPGGRRL